jgi:hypothetical protein
MYIHSTDHNRVQVCHVPRSPRTPVHDGVWATTCRGPWDTPTLVGLWMR